MEELAALDANFTAIGKIERLICGISKIKLTRLMKRGGSPHTRGVVDRAWYLYLLMERIYRDNGLEREERKFSGRPMREMMEKVEQMFNAAKAMLREFKDDSITVVYANVNTSLKLK